MTQADVYFFTVSKVAEYVDYHGAVRVLTDVLKACKDPVVSADLRTAIDILEQSEKEREELERRYVYAESIF